jgi:hypothetical protein
LIFISVTRIFLVNQEDAMPTYAVIRRKPWGKYYYTEDCEPRDVFEIHSATEKSLRGWILRRDGETIARQAYGDYDSAPPKEGHSWSKRPSGVPGRVSRDRTLVICGEVSVAFKALEIMLATWERFGIPRDFQEKTLRQQAEKALESERIKLQLEMLAKLQSLQSAVTQAREIEHRELARLRDERTQALLAAGVSQTEPTHDS